MHFGTDREHPKKRHSVTSFVCLEMRDRAWFLPSNLGHWCFTALDLQTEWVTHLVYELPLAATSAITALQAATLHQTIVIDH